MGAAGRMSSTDVAWAPGRVMHAVRHYGLMSETFVADTIAETDRQGWQAWVAAGRASNREHFPFPAHGRVLVASPEQRRETFTGRLRLRSASDRRSTAIEEACRIAEPALIHAHFGWAAADARLAAKHLRLPLVATFHASDILIWPGMSRMYRDYRRLFREVDRVMAVSEYIAAKLRERGFDRPIDIVPPGVRLTEFTFRPPRSPGRAPRLVFVGRLVRRKGLDLLLCAFATVLGCYPKAELEVLGDGACRKECEQLAQSLGVAQKVDFRGPQPVSAVSQAMRRADVFVMSSRTMPNGEAEGSPVVTKEALAIGLQVVACDSGGTIETIPPEYRHEIVPEDDAQALARQLIAVLDAQAEWPERARIGREWVEQEFDWDVLSRRIVSIYEDVIVAHPHAGRSR